MGDHLLLRPSRCLGLRRARRDNIGHGNFFSTLPLQFAQDKVEYQHKYYFHNASPPLAAMPLLRVTPQRCVSNAVAISVTSFLLGVSARSPKKSQSLPAGHGNRDSACGQR